jgi:hypothetical protein
LFMINQGAVWIYKSPGKTPNPRAFRARPYARRCLLIAGPPAMCIGGTEKWQLPKDFGGTNLLAEVVFGECATCCVR